MKTDRPSIHSSYRCVCTTTVPSALAVLRYNLLVPDTAGMRVTTSCGVTPHLRALSISLASIIVGRPRLRMENGWPSRRWEQSIGCNARRAACPAKISAARTSAPSHVNFVLHLPIHWVKESVRSRAWGAFRMGLLAPWYPRRCEPGERRAPSVSLCEYAETVKYTTCPAVGQALVSHGRWHDVLYRALSSHSVLSLLGKSEHGPQNVETHQGRCASLPATNTTCACSSSICKYLTCSERCLIHDLVARGAVLACFEQCVD